MSTPNSSAPASAPNAPTQNTTQTEPQTQGTQPNATQTQAPKTYNLKVDGQELSLTEAEVIALAQQGKSASKRFQEAAQTRKQAEDIIRFAKENPTEFFAKTGMNARQWAEQYLLEQIQHEQMSPEQKKALENEQRLKNYEARDKAQKENERKRQMDELEARERQTYDQMFTQALSQSGLPRTAYTVKRMAELTIVAEKRGLKLDPSQLAKIVREDYIAEQKALLTSLDGEQLIEMLGKEAVKKLGKAQLSKYKATARPTGSGKDVPRSPDKGLDPVQAFKDLRKRNRRPVF